MLVYIILVHSVISSDIINPERGGAIFQDLTYEETSGCPLCASKRRQVYDHGADTLTQEINRYVPKDVSSLPTLQNSRNLCKSCKLIYLSPRLSPKSLGTIYKYWYQYTYHHIFDDSGHLKSRKKEFEQYHFQALSRVCPKPGYLLDVGCGSGIFLSVARRHGWRGFGIELDPHTAIKGEKQFNVPIRAGTIQSTLFDRDKFDAITLFDYLEHTSTPGQDLALLTRHLLPGGVILIRVPNRNSLQSLVMRSKWLAIISNHLSYYNKKTLQIALASHGLEVIHMSAGNYRTEWDIIKQKIQWVRSKLNPSKEVEQSSQAVRSSPQSSKRGSSIRMGLRLAYSIFIEQLDHIGGWFGLGNNLMVIAKKK